MALMSFGQEDSGQRRQNSTPHGRGRGYGPSPQNRGPPPGRPGYRSDPRQDSGHFEGNAYPQQYPPNHEYPQQGLPRPNPEPVRRPSQRQQYEEAPPAPLSQRSQTMPYEMASEIDGINIGAQQQWAEPGPVAGYHGPESPSYIPPRPSTASGSRSNGNYQPQYQQAPPVPQASQHRQQQSQDDIDNFYDDYYGNEGTQDQENRASIDMPNFDAIPEPVGKHRRGFSIENHLAPPPGGNGQFVPQAGAGAADPQARENFQQHAMRSRSQPDLHAQYQQETAYEMPGDIPAVPQLPRANTMNVASNGYQDGGDVPVVPPLPRANTMNAGPPNGLPTGPRGRMPPPRGPNPSAMPGRGPPPGQGYLSGPPPNSDPRLGRQQPPVNRGYSNESQWSDPGPQGMRNGPPMPGNSIQRAATAAPMSGHPIHRPGTAAPMPGNPIQRPGTAAPMPSRHPSDPLHHRPGTAQPQQPINPDALPAHPAPVRPGLMQQQHSTSPPPVSRPAPVRHYNTEPAPSTQGFQQAAAAVPPERRASVPKPHPVTHDELNRLRKTWNLNPGDHATALQLAKKLVEAAKVLADEGGTADTRTRNKNREKFIMEAYKIVKKLVAAGYPDAMFYMADCYGQGQLGLQVDTKEAFSLYQSAAKAGHAASAYRTAVCCEMGHEDGGGTKKDPLKAVQWYRRAAALGDPPAMYKMGMILLKGLLGQQKNLGEAVNMLKRAADCADEQNPHALHELALLYESDTGNERIIKDEAYAFSLFEQAAKLGYKFSQFRLGQAYEYGHLGCPIDPRSSIGWYTRAAAQGEHQSELALSGWYLTGSQGILNQSDTEAYLWARTAACAEPPLPKALFAMGYFTEVGIGCPRSLEEAKKWYGRAAGEFFLLFFMLFGSFL